MLIRTDKTIPEFAVTPREHYTSRRTILGATAAVLGATAMPAIAASLPEKAGARLSGIAKSPLSTSEPVNSYDDVTTYNNFYEFGTGKGDPARNAVNFRPRPWTLTVGGEADVTGSFDLDDFVKPYGLEERIYRFRCVEAWSMVVPWVGIPLADVIRRYQPTSRAKFVRFETLHDPERMPGQRRAVLDWPYVEGLTIAEATHPLSLLVVGVYGEVLPNQNGAPLRLIVPWKYGFKSIKSIVRMDFVESIPATSWNLAAPNEYGFYANVNPGVDHPRWSQASERKIGSGLFAERIPTQLFNGYADQVEGLYAGLDLRRNF